MTSALAEKESKSDCAPANGARGAAAEQAAETAAELREEILRLVRKYQQVRFGGKAFSPGKIWCIMPGGCLTATRW